MKICILVHSFFPHGVYSIYLICERTIEMIPKSIVFIYLFCELFYNF